MRFFAVIRLNAKYNRHGFDYTAATGKVFLAQRRYLGIIKTTAK